MKVLKYEMKKIFSKSVNKMVLVALMVVLVMISFWTIREVQYLHEDGETTDYGIIAARQLKKETNRWNGYLTRDTLQKVIVENEKINVSEENLSDDENDKAYAKKQGYSDIRYMVNEAFSEFDADYDWYKMDYISVDEVSRIYEQRIENMKNWLNAEDIVEVYTKQKKEFLINNYESLDTPIYYEYCEGWKALLDSQYMPTLLIILMLAIGFLVSGIFSDEISLKTDAIFFSAKLGRGKAILAKIGAGFLVITVLYWFTVLLYSLIVLGILGFDGAECAIQICVWKACYNINFWQYYCLVVIAGYVGCLFILNLSMLISVKTYSSVLAISTTFVLTCVTPFIGRIPVFKSIMEKFPEMLLRLNTVIDDISLYQIGDKVFRSFEVLIPMYLVLSFIIVPVLYFGYRKIERK